jgi:hypothetical protein
MSRLAVIIPLMLMLMGCAANSGIVPMGASTFMVSKQAATGFGGMGNLKAQVLQQAQAHCAEAGRDFEVVSITESKPPYIFANYPRADLQFRCVDFPEKK